MDKFWVLVITLALIHSCSSQVKSVEEIKEELKKLLTQEAQIYEAKLRLLQQLQNLQQDVANIPPVLPTLQTSPPVAVTVTRIVTPSEEDSATPLSIVTFTRTTTAAASATTTAPNNSNLKTFESTSSSTSGQSSTSSKSVPDIVSFSEVRVDSPSIIILRGQRKAVVRS